MSQSTSAPGMVWEIDVGEWKAPAPPISPKKGVKGKRRKASKTGTSATGQRLRKDADGREGSDMSSSEIALPDGMTTEPDEHDEDESVFGDDMAIDYEPPKHHATVDLMQQRKFIDLKKWYCISRPQYSKSCGISSLVSCWNYLFSKLGSGSLRPITQEEALTVLDFKPPFGQIKFGPFTGNQTLMRWFKQLNDHFGVRGRGYFLYKPIGRNRTSGVKGDQAVKKLKECLRKDDTAVIYHCLNHYFCPIGYEEVPCKAWDAYNCKVPEKDLTTWILVGDPSKKHPGMHCIKWDDIEQDLNLDMPEFLDVRRLHRGIQNRNTSKKSGNMHCLMVFQRSIWQGRKPLAQKCAQRRRSEGDKTVKTVYKAKSMRRKKEVLNSENSSDVHLPPIEGASNIRSDDDDEMKHWIESGALEYRVSESFADQNGLSEPKVPYSGGNEINDETNWRLAERKAEFGDFCEGEESCVKSVINLSIGGASMSVQDIDGVTREGDDNTIETESDCMSWEDVDEILEVVKRG